MFHARREERSGVEGETAQRALTSVAEDIKGKRQRNPPVQVWTGPEDSRRFRLPDFQTVGI
jgi:hypothetical protein